MDARACRTNRSPGLYLFGHLLWNNVCSELLTACVRYLFIYLHISWVFFGLCNVDCDAWFRKHCTLQTKAITYSNSGVTIIPVKLWFFFPIFAKRKWINVGRRMRDGWAEIGGYICTDKFIKLVRLQFTLYYILNVLKRAWLNNSLTVRMDFCAHYKHWPLALSKVNSKINNFA